MSAVEIARLPSGVFRLRTRIVLAGTPDDVFPFFGDAANLEALTPPLLRFQILTPLPVEMHVGTLLDYRLRLHGVPIRWRTLITAWEPGVRFVDEQLRGPYRIWRHEHRFTALPDGTTEATDEVVYALPLGRLAHRLVVERDLRAIFAYRHAQLGRLLGVPAAA